MGQLVTHRVRRLCCALTTRPVLPTTLAEAIMRFSTMRGSEYFEVILVEGNEKLFRLTRKFHSINVYSTVTVDNVITSTAVQGAGTATNARQVPAKYAGRGDDYAHWR